AIGSSGEAGGGCLDSVKIRGGQAGVRGFAFGGFDVGANLFRVGHIVVGQNVGVGHSQRLEAEHACHLLQVCEVGIGVLNVPGVVVEGGVVNAVGPAGADVGGGHARVLEEGREVRTGAEIANAHFFARNGWGIGGAMFVFTVPVGAPLLVDGIAHGAGDRFCDLAHELFERRNSGSGEVGPGDSYVNVEVGDCMIECLGVLLDPF